MSWEQNKRCSNVVCFLWHDLLFVYSCSQINWYWYWYWLCVGKRETSFPVNKLWLIYLPPSLWPLIIHHSLHMSGFASAGGFCVLSLFVKHKWPLNFSVFHDNHKVHSACKAFTHLPVAFHSAMLAITSNWAKNYAPKCDKKDNPRVWLKDNVRCALTNISLYR